MVTIFPLKRQIFLLLKIMRMNEMNENEFQYRMKFHKYTK